VSRLLAGQLIRGQTNFLKMLFKFSKVYNIDRFCADHDKPVAYAMRRPEEYAHKPTPSELVVHVGINRPARAASIEIDQRQAESRTEPAGTDVGAV
jgi:hypothetical protein